MPRKDLDAGHTQPTVKKVRVHGEKGAWEKSSALTGKRGTIVEPKAPSALTRLAVQVQEYLIPASF